VRERLTETLRSAVREGLGGPEQQLSMH